MWSPSPKGRLARSEELCKVHLISSDVSIQWALNLRGGGGENAGLLASLPKGRKISPRAKAEAAAAGEASRLEQAVARASPRRPAGSGRRAQLRCCTLDGRPEGQSRLQYLSPGSRRCTVCQGAELPPPAATERPRRVRGRGGAAAASTRLLLLLTAAGSVDPSACSPSEAAAAPAVPGRSDRTPAPPRRGRKPGPGPRSESPGRAPAHSSLRPGEAGGRGRAGATAPQRAEGRLRLRLLPARPPAAAGPSSALPPVARSRSRWRRRERRRSHAGGAAARASSLSP